MMLFAEKIMILYIAEEIPDYKATKTTGKKMSRLEHEQNRNAQVKTRRGSNILTMFAHLQW